VGWQIQTVTGDPDRTNGFLMATITAPDWSGMGGQTFKLPVPVDKLKDPTNPAGPAAPWNGQCALSPIIIPIDKTVTLFGFQVALSELTLSTNGVTLGDATISFPSSTPGNPQVSFTDVLVDSSLNVSGGEAVLSMYGGRLTVVAADVHLNAGRFTAGTVNIGLPPILGGTANVGLSGFGLTYSSSGVSVQGTLSSFSFQMASASVTVTNARLDSAGVLKVESASVHVDILRASSVDIAVNGLTYDPSSNALTVDNAKASFTLPEFKLGKFGISGGVTLQLKTATNSLVYEFAGNAKLASPALTLEASITFGSSGAGVVGIDGKEHPYTLYSIALSAKANTGITIPYTPLELYGLGGALQITGTVANPVYIFSVSTSVRTIDKGLLMDAESLTGTLSTEGNFKLEGKGSLFNVPDGTGKAALLLGNGTACLILTATDNSFCNISITATQPGAYIDMKAQTDPSTFIGRQVALKGSVTGQLTLQSGKPSVSASFAGSLNVSAIGLSGDLKNSTISLTYPGDQPTYKMSVDAELKTDPATTLGKEVPITAQFKGNLTLTQNSLDISATFNGTGTIARLGLGASMDGSLGRFNRAGETATYFGVKATGSGQVPAFDVWNLSWYQETINVPFFAGVDTGGGVPFVCIYSTLPPFFCSADGFSAAGGAMGMAMVSGARTSDAGAGSGRTVTFTVNPGEGNLLVALTWQHGAPGLTLIAPNGTDIMVPVAVHDPAVDPPSGGHATALIVHADSEPGTWQAEITNLQGGEQEQFNYAQVPPGSSSPDLAPAARSAASTANPPQDTALRAAGNHLVIGPMGLAGH
jgi:hypothetical protein